MTVRGSLSDLRWSLPWATYRLSGRRVQPSQELYRVGIPRQRWDRARLPGMTSPSERAYFKWHSQEVFTGAGAIVDLGSWFGSTTATLAMGLERNPRPAARSASIDAFDRFVWEEWMDDYAAAARFGPYREGDSFVREFERTVGPWAKRVRVHAGDLCDERWPEDPIDVLLVDAMKSWEVTDHIASEFFRPLAEGAGHVIHQDFGNCFTPWIHLLTYRLRRHVVTVNDIPDSETVVFKLVHSLSGVTDELDVSRDAFDDSEIEEAFAHSLRITRSDKHSGINAARVMLLVYDGDVEQAEHRLGVFVRAGKLSTYHAEVLRGALKRAAGDREPGSPPPRLAADAPSRASQRS